jgi:hypothetical protein
VNPWTAIIAIEGEVSEDKRLVRPGAFDWDTPLPLIDYGTSREEGTFEYKIIGTVESIERIVGEDGRNIIRATGVRWEELPAGLGPSVSSTNGEFDTDIGVGGVMAFKRATIKAIFCGTPIWPDVRFEDV